MWLQVGCRKKRAPKLHTMDVDTRFQNAIFLKGNQDRDIWDLITEAWMTVYTGYPHTLKADHKSVFISENGGNGRLKSELMLRFGVLNPIIHRVLAKDIMIRFE